jgi:PAS domain S-box-containing protein
LSEPKTHMIRKLLKIVQIVFFAGLLIMPYKANAQEPDRMLAIWIVQNFAPNVTWRNESALTEYTIGVFGNTTQIYNELVEFSKTRTIKGKKINVLQFNRIRDIKPVQILFVEAESNSEVRSIFEKLDNTLLITDQYPSGQHIMINMLSPQSKKKFEINKANAIDGGITYSDNILVHGGDEVVLKEMVSKSLDQLLSENKELALVNASFEKQKDELNQLERQKNVEREENKRQKLINRQQLEEMEVQENELKKQREQLGIVQKNLEELQAKLTVNSAEVQEQIKKIGLQGKEVAKRDEEIQKQINEIEKNRKIISAKDSEFSVQETYISFQIRILIGFFLSMIAIMVLVFYIWRGYKLKQKINEELREKNEAINQQKEELASQQHYSDLLNKELEKLSIVASKTDNAVSIMDIRGNYEWINVGFTRLYGYTMQLLKNEMDGNIVGLCKNPNITEYLEKCRRTKKSVVFESRNYKRTGAEIWVQTSLTPILDIEREISKLITIETDITNIKKAENEIRVQHEKILEQTQELENTNKELEKLSLVASGTDNAIAIMDSAGNYQWINEGYHRLFGYTFNQLVAEYSGNIISKDTPNEVKILVKQCIEELKYVTFEHVQKTRNNLDVWVQTNLTPITDKNKNIKYLISISIDISQLKKAEQAIRQQKEELMAQKEELVLQKDKIEIQNQNIRASITYAKTIQNATLPALSSLNQNFGTFVIFKPKDIVSGDFYWYSRLASDQNGANKYFYAAVDCTGHGVPGAFMSMIGSRILKDIVNDKKIDKPSKILETLNKEIKMVLRQEETDNNDGMDVCLCMLEPSNNGNTKITFSGAKRPLYFYKSSDKKLYYIKGTRKTVGGTHARRNKEEFTDYEIMLHKGDMVYLSTDGIVDQPSPDRIRFGSVRFISLLKEIADKPLSYQKQSIESKLLDYQENEQQRDDVTFLGIQV